MQPNLSTAKLPVILVSNMFPSAQMPAKGAFVARAAQQLQEAGYQVQPITLPEQVGKLAGYWVFYRDIVNTLVTAPQSIVYAHFVSHLALPVLLANGLRWLLGRPAHQVCSHVHGGDVHLQVGRNRWFFALKRQLAKALLKRSQVVITPSERYAALVRELLDHRQGSPNVRVVCSGGVDLEQFAMGQQAASSRLDFIYVSRMEALKRPLLAVDYLRQLASDCPTCLASVQFFGGGAQQQQLQAYAQQQLGNRILKRVQGAVPMQQVAALLQQQHAFILLSQEESLGLAPLEAMACGCVVFLSKIPAFSEYIDDGINGYLVGSAQEFSSKVQQFCQLSAAQQASIRAAARATVEQRYSAAIARHQLVKVFSDYGQTKA